MVLLPTTSWAQDEGGEAATAEEQSDARKNVSASGYATTEQPFEIRRGFSVDGEFGVFMTFGGRNSNAPEQGFPDVTVSNANPYVALIFGYDLISTNSFALSLGPKLGAAFNGGGSRLSDSDLQAAADGSTFVNDFGAYEAGLNVSLNFMVTERLAVTTKLNGGVVFIDSNPNVDFCGSNADNPGPSPTLPAQPDDEQRRRFREQCGSTDAGDLAIGGMFGASAGIEFFTRLTGFSVGLQLRFQGLLVDGFIPGFAIPATLKYTF